LAKEYIAKINMKCVNCLKVILKGDKYYIIGDYPNAPICKLCWEPAKKDLEYSEAFVKEQNNLVYNYGYCKKCGWKGERKDCEKNLCPYCGKPISSITLKESFKITAEQGKGLKSSDGKEYTPEYVELAYNKAIKTLLNAGKDIRDYLPSDN
jgi:hypothetical protein